jgi:ribosomal protein S27AE
MVGPTPPVDAPIGTTWKPDGADPKGPLAGERTSRAEVGPLADGLVRVLKTCKRCGQDFEGWIFAAHHRARIVRLESDLKIATEAGNRDHMDKLTALLADPLKVGAYSACGKCAAHEEDRAEISSLQTKVEQLRDRWQRAKVVGDRLAAARQLAKLLTRQVAFLKFGSERFKKVSDQLDAVRDWVGEHRVDTEEM